MGSDPERGLTPILLAIVLLVPTLLTAHATAAEPADLILHNGTVLVLDQANTQTSAIAVRDGKVLATGGAELLTAYDGQQIVDLAGRIVMPGFNDTHVHVSGKPQRYIDLTKARSVAEIKRLVSAKAAELDEGEWISGYGWSEDELSEGRRPLMHDLDAAAPGNPVMLTRAGAHSAVFSSEAFRRAGITAATPDPEGGTIERDAGGQLNGIIRERHNELVGHLVPEASNEELRPSLIAELQSLFSLGITSITEASKTVDEFKEWETVYASRAGSLPRASVQLHYAGKQAMADSGLVYGHGNEHLRAGAIKIFADGGFTGPAAFTTRPYKGEDEYRGKLNMPEHELRSLIRTVHADGWQMGIHAIGDAAIELVVRYLVEALADMPRANHRHYLNHFTVMPSVATMSGMAANGIAITQQPNFAYTLEGRYVAYLDGERLEHNNPMATPMSHGVHVAMSSDILPLGPWVGVYAASTRKGMSGRVFGPDERISRFEALRAYTAKGAYLTHEERLKGTLEPGMFADFIVLPHNPLTVPDDLLLDMQADEVYLAGRSVWQRTGTN